MVVVKILEKYSGIFGAGLINHGEFPPSRFKSF